MKLLSAGLVTVVTAIAGEAPAQAQAVACHELFRTGFRGEVVGGSKTALISAVEQGQAVRVGWKIDFDNDGKHDLSHWADAMFLTVFEGEVFAQIDAIQRQQPMAGKADISLFPDRYLEWRGSIGSNGKLKGIFGDGSASPPDSATVAVTWCGRG